MHHRCSRCIPGSGSHDRAPPTRDPEAVHPNAARTTDFDVGWTDVRRSAGVNSRASLLPVRSRARASRRPCVASRRAQPGMAPALRLPRRLAGIWGPTTFMGASVIAARRQPGYTHRAQPISGLAALGTPSAVVMVPGFLALALAGLLFEVEDRVARVFVRATGAGLLVSTIARCSTPECPSPFIDSEHARPTDVSTPPRVSSHSLRGWPYRSSASFGPDLAGIAPLARRWHRSPPSLMSSASRRCGDSPNVVVSTSAPFSLAPSVGTRSRRLDRSTSPRTAGKDNAVETWRFPTAPAVTPWSALGPPTTRR